MLVNRILKINIMIHTILTDEQIINLYLDYCNNFVTIEGFGLHYGINYDNCIFIIDKGMRLINCF
jgi:hypothetical protein